jgi:hypothetical protein
VLGFGLRLHRRAIQDVSEQVLYNDVRISVLDELAAFVSASLWYGTA